MMRRFTSGFSNGFRPKVVTFAGALVIATSGVTARAETFVTGVADPRLAAFDRFMIQFLADHQAPGAALAIGREGRIVYARGFGLADVAVREPVEPDALFRIASVSKPFTAVAVLQLQEQGKLNLDAPAFDLLPLEPHLRAGAVVDPRLRRITVRQLLHHTGGFDRDRSFDPMVRSIQICLELDVRPPPMPPQIIEYMMGRPLDFDPGTREVYSNFGYCVLGRVIEKISGERYGDYVETHILHPLQIQRMRLARSLAADRAPGEVRYYPRGDPTVPSAFDPTRSCFKT